MSVMLILYPLIIPFLCSASGGVHESSKIRELFGTAETSCGGAVGAGATTILQSKTKLYFFYIASIAVITIILCKGKHTIFRGDDLHRETERPYCHCLCSN